MISLKFGIGLLLLSLQVEDVVSKGKIHLNLAEYHNPTGTDADGNCCDKIQISGCPIGKCDHLFRICISNTIQQLNSTDCLQSTDIIGPSDHNEIIFDKNQQPIQLAFDTWKGEVHITVDVYDSNTDGNILVDQFSLTYNSSKASYNQTSNVPTIYNLSGKRQKNPTSLKFSLSVFCDPQYYEDDCSVKCVPTNECGGHYTCDNKGKKVCHPGWRGTSCAEQVPGSAVDCSIYANKTDFIPSAWEGVYKCSGETASHPLSMNVTTIKDTLDVVAKLVLWNDDVIQMPGYYSSFTRSLTLQTDSTIFPFDNSNFTKVSLETNMMSSSTMKGRLTFYRGNGTKLTCFVDPLLLKKAYFDGCDFKGTCWRNGPEKDSYSCCCDDGTMGKSCTKTTTSKPTILTTMMASTTTTAKAETTAKITTTVEPTTNEPTGTFAPTTAPTVPTKITGLLNNQSTTTTDRHDVSCNPDSMSVYIPSALLSQNNYLTWTDPHCKVINNGTHYISTVSHTACGTIVKFTHDEVIFENDIFIRQLGATPPTSPNDTIDFGSDSVDTISVQCIYPRRQNVTMSYRPANTHIRFYEKRYGHMDVQLEQYQSDKFVSVISGTSYPREVLLNKDMYIKLRAMHTNTTDIAIKVDSCVATPSAMPADGSLYQLIDHGCPASPAVKLYPSSFDEVKFSVKAFQFKSSPGSIVYIHCQISVCSPTNPQCVTGCKSRHRRDVDEADDSSHLVSGGPYLLVADKGSLQMSTVVAGVCACLAVVATVFAVIGWKRKSTKYNLVS